jgi:hypothetical protein
MADIVVQMVNEPLIAHPPQTSPVVGVKSGSRARGAPDAALMTHSNVYWVAQIIRAAQTAAGRIITLCKTQAISRQRSAGGAARSIGMGARFAPCEAADMVQARAGKVKINGKSATHRQMLLAA